MAETNQAKASAVQTIRESPPNTREAKEARGVVRKMEKLKASANSKGLSSQEHEANLRAVSGGDDSLEKNRFSLNPQDRALLMSAAIQKVTAPSLKSQGDYLIEQGGWRDRSETYGNKRQHDYFAESDYHPGFELTKTYASHHGPMAPKSRFATDQFEHTSLGKRHPKGLGPLDYDSGYEQLEGPGNRRLQYGTAGDPLEYTPSGAGVNRFQTGQLLADYYSPATLMKTAGGDMYMRRGAAKPPVIKEGDWHCLECTNVNWARRTTCNL